MRKAVLDGWPVDRVIGSDLHQGKSVAAIRIWLTLAFFFSDFLNLGKELFTAADVQPALLAGDIFDPDFFSPSSTSTLADLSAITSLTPLQGHVSVLHASAFLHLFDGKTKIRVLRIFLQLVQNQAGSIIFGSHRLRPANEPPSDGQWQSKEEFENLVRRVLAEAEAKWEVNMRAKEVSRNGKTSDIVYFSFERQ